MSKINKHKAFLFFLIALQIPCFAGGIKGDIVSDEALAGIVIYIILIHIFSIAAYYGRTLWVRIVCGILYLPVFLIPLVMTLLNASFIILFIPFLLFYGFMLARTRK